MEQSGTSNRDASKPTTTAPPVEVAAKAREEDSGLHDIRNLAQSTKNRIKRTTGNLPHITQKDEDVLSSSSASWKNLALPQPAAMVSLPELAELPNNAQAKREAKEQKAAAKAAAAQAPVSVSAIEASSSMSGSVEYKPAFSSTMPQARPAAANNNKRRNIALIGMGVAAAAGITIFIATQKNAAKSDPTTASAPANSAAVEQKAPVVVQAAPTVTPIPEQPVDQTANAGSAAATGGAAGDEGKVAIAAVAPPKVVSKRAGNANAKGKVVAEVAPAPAADKAAVEKPPTKTGKPEEGDPDFNQLLKEAGVKDKKVAVKLDKKELTSDDFKKGMAAITAKAQACYKGTQGSANVKLTIAPSGSVSKVTVNGAFAGKPEGDCVAAAVKTASFPAWDGGPQSFGYPILLSE